MSEDVIWAYFPEGVLEIIGVGSSSLVGDLGNGQVLKYPLEKEVNEEDIRHEAEIYKILGLHPRILAFYGPQSVGFRLQKAVNGTIREYLEKTGVSAAQKWQWACQLAEAIEFIHAKGVIHNDISTRNCFLDDFARCL